jgi:lipopolysaccharide transport system permease protein
MCKANVSLFYKYQSYHGILPLQPWGKIVYLLSMEYEIKPHEKLSLGVKELWQYRELFFFFTWRDIKIKYKQTVLGFAWAVLQPLIMMFIFAAVGNAFNIPNEGMPRPMFVFAGLLLWNVFSSGLTNAGNSMVTNANIIKKIYFPRLIIPVSSVLVSLFDFIMTFIIFIGMLVFYVVRGEVHVDIVRFILILPVSLFITSIATFGIGSLLASLNIKYRDFRYVIPFMVSVLLFLTPVIYPISGTHFHWAKYILAINPLYSAIELFRSTFSNSTLHIYLVLISLTSSILFFVAGLFYFRKTEAYFADLV